MHRSLVHVSFDVLQDIKVRQSQRAVAIFNNVETGQSVKGDGKRRQFRLGKSKILQPFIVELNDKISQLTSQRPSSWVAIQSLPGCEGQPAHTDYPPMPGQADADVPLAVLVALMPDTRLCVWPQSRRPKEVHLLPGDVLVFRGDLVHAGAAYANENVRLHCFLGEHHSNRTWLVDAHATSPN